MGKTKKNRTVKINDLCEFTNGHGFTPDDWKSSGLPIIRIQNLNGSKKFNYFQGNPDQKWLVRPGDILFAWAGVKGVSFGSTVWKGEIGVLNQHIFKVEPKKNVNKLWLSYILQLVTQRIEKKAHGFKSSLVHVNKKDITGQSILLPQSSTQEIQANILLLCDSLIQKTEALIAAKKKRFGWLCQLYFQPNNHTNLSWKKCKIREFLKIRNEFSVPTKDNPLYSLTIENGVTAKTDRYNREFLVKNRENKTYKVVYPKDIVFNPANLRWGAIARSEVSHAVVLSPIYEVFSVEESKIDSDYLTYALICERQIRIFSTKVEGTLIERMAVKADIFQLCEILVPPTLEEQKHIAHILNTAKKEITLLEKLAEKYRLQKKGLMQKLLTGEWRVNNPIDHFAELSKMVAKEKGAK